MRSLMMMFIPLLLSWSAITAAFGPPNTTPSQSQSHCSQSHCSQSHCSQSQSRLPAPRSQQWLSTKRPPSSTTAMTATTTTTLHQGSTDNVSVNGAGSVSGAGVDSGASGNGDTDVSAAAAAAVGGLVTASDAKSRLFSAFTALELPDQYDAVLTGLCAKILDNEIAVPVSSGVVGVGDAKSTSTAKALLDPMQLLQEMNQKRIVASPRSIMALIDSTVKAQDAQLMAQVLSLCLKNGGVQSYGSLQASILLLPSTPTSQVKCPDGSRKTRTERLASVADIPVDHRSNEVSSALAVAAVAAGCTLTDVVHADDITLYANTLLSAMLAVGVVDNFYDVIKSVSALAAKQLKKNNTNNDTKKKKKKNCNSDSDNDNDNDNDSSPLFQLPEKESLPLGLGTGQVSGSVVRGLTRLLTVDAERECACEAAALYAAYTLGLPCFSFRPNALEASVLVVESIKDDDDDDDDDSNNNASLLSASGIMRVLVWLMAPVAMESTKHAQLIVSDPREAEGFLLRLEEYAKNTNAAVTPEDLWWTDDAQERADLLKWAFTEADLLLRDNKAVVNDISNRLTGGAATIGDCVATMERW